MVRLRVYVSGPYTNGDSCINTHKAVEAGDRLLELGMAPLVPHLSHFWHTMSPHDYEEWMAIDLAWVEAADAVLRLPGESSGADREVARARALVIPVFHSIDELALWADNKGK